MGLQGLDGGLRQFRVALGEFGLKLVEHPEQVVTQQQLTATRRAGADAEGKDLGGLVDGLGNGAGTASISKPQAPAVRPSSMMRMASSALPTCSLKPP